MANEERLPMNYTNKINEQIKDDKKVSIALMAPFVILTIQYFILISFSIQGTASASHIQLISKVIVGAVFLYILPVVLRKSKVKLLIIYIIFVLIFLVHYLLFPENLLYLKELVFPLFFMGLPAFVYSLTIDNWTILKQMMKKAGLIVFLFGAFQSILIFTGQVTLGSYSMSLSYYMLLPTLLFLDEFLNKFSMKAFLLSIVSIIIILALGSRGPILSIIIFVFLMLIRSSSKFSFKKTFIYGTFISISLFIIIFFKQILVFLDNLLLNFGIQSRTIRLFLREDLYLSGRDSLYQAVIDGISNKPVLGLGIGGDRLVNNGSYVHNLFLEIQANYGVIFGTIVGVLIVMLIIKALFVKNKELYSLIIIWLSLGFVPLMVSSSYLTDLRFWILMGLIVNITLLGRGRHKSNSNI